MLEGVAHVPASRALVFSEQGLSRESRRDAWSTMPSAETWSVEQSADALENALDRAVAAWTQTAGEINIALSGGADSRLLLPFVRRHVRHVRASTFGELRSLEVTVASRLCEATDTVHHVCDLGHSPSMSTDRLASFALETESLGDSAGPFYWRQWLDFLAAEGVPVMTGYLGGIGGRLLCWGVPRGKLLAGAELAREDVARHPVAEGKALMPFARDAFRADLGEGIGVRLASSYSSLPGEKVYERLRSLEVSQRQRRYIGWYPEVYERSVRTVHPFLSESVLDALARIPLNLERAAAQRVLARLLPNGGRFPDSNTGRRIAHAGRLDFWRDATLHNRYATRLTEFLGRPERLALSTFRRRIEAHRAHIVHELQHPNAALDELIDMPGAAAAVGDARIPPYLQMRLYNVARFTRWFYA